MVLETDRFLLEVGGAPPLDTEGFLEVPPPDAWWITPDSRPIPVGELVGSAGFALLAIAGAGKSTLLNSLQSLEPISVEIDLRTLDAGGIAAALDIALAQEGPVYLDSIDEAALLVPSLFRILEQRLSTPDAARIPWRLACRPAAWNQHFARALKQHLPTFREFHLLPVTRDAAKQIASAVGTDPDAFVEAIADAHLGRLSATPGRLRAVAEQWHATSTLPTDSVEAMQFEVAQLLEEPDAGRPQPALAIDRRLRVAQRLGAISIFCGWRGSAQRTQPVRV